MKNPKTNVLKTLSFTLLLLVGISTSVQAAEPQDIPLQTATHESNAPIVKRELTSQRSSWKSLAAGFASGILLPGYGMGPAILMMIFNDSPIGHQERNDDAATYMVGHVAGVGSVISSVVGFGFAKLCTERPFPRVLSGLLVWYALLFSLT